MNHVDTEQIHHVARLAFLAMASRAVASATFESDPAVDIISVVVTRSKGHQPAIELLYGDCNDNAIAGMSL